MAEEAVGGQVRLQEGRNNVGEKLRGGEGNLREMVGGGRMGTGGCTRER